MKIKIWQYFVQKVKKANFVTLTSSVTDALFYVSILDGMYIIK